MELERTAIIVTGTRREIGFLSQLFPRFIGTEDADVFLVLRHTTNLEQSRLRVAESDFELEQFLPKCKQSLYLAELPSVDGRHIKDQFLIPTGPTDPDREIAMVSMFTGVFAAIAMLKSAQRDYKYVLKTRTDYLPEFAPWVPECINQYHASGGKCIVDGSMTLAERYPDRSSIPWQGSISDVFFFGAYERFIQIWDFGESLSKIWTGIPETTLFRNAFKALTGDDLQSKRRNETLLKNYFTWTECDEKQPRNMLREGVLSEQLKEFILNIIAVSDDSRIGKVSSLIRLTYDYIAVHAGAVGSDLPDTKRIYRGDLDVREELISNLDLLMTKPDSTKYLEMCHRAADSINPT